MYKTGLFGTLKRIIKTEGVRGLYRGILPEYYKVVPGVGICFMTYETLKLYFMDLSPKLQAGFYVVEFLGLFLVKSQNCKSRGWRIIYETIVENLYVFLVISSEFFLTCYSPS